LALRIGRLLERTGKLERAASWYRAACVKAGSAPHVEIEATLGLGAVRFFAGARAETGTLAERALSLLATHPHPRLHAAARRLQALVAQQDGDPALAERLLLSALEDLEAAGAERQVVEVLLDLARLAKERSEVLSAVRYARRALHQARSLNEPAAIAEAHTVLARGFVFANRFAVAKRTLTRGLRVARQAGDRLREASLVREIGNLRLRQGDLRGAVNQYNRALELARVLRARSEESACLHNIGILTTLRGELRAAVSALRSALDINNEIGDAASATFTSIELGHTYAELGRLDDALGCLSAGIEMGVAMADPVVAAEGTALRLWVEQRLGRLENISGLAETAFTLIDPLEDPASRALTLLYIGRCAINLGLTADALQITERLIDEVQHNLLIDFVAGARGVYGKALAAAGERERATPVLQDAAATAQAQGLRPTQVEILLALGEVWAGRDRGAAALTQAMEILQTIVAEMPPEMAAVYLSTPESQRLRAAFGREHQRVFGD